jgi:hypothetical protein
VQSVVKEVRIEELRSRNNENVREWRTEPEDCDHPTQEFCFGTGKTFVSDFSMNLNTSMIAFIMPALLWATRVIQKKII